MKSGTLTLLIGVVVGAIALLLFVNYLTHIVDPGKAKYITLGNVKGMAVIANDKEFTLNADQQVQAIQIFNQSARLKSNAYKDKKPENFPYSKVVIYRAEKENIEVVPVRLVNTQLVFSCTEWNPDGLLQEVGPGSLNDLFISAIKQ